MPAILIYIIRYTNEPNQEFDRYESFEPTDNVTAAFSGPMKTFGIIGFRKTRGTPGIFKSWFAKKHVCSLLFINNEELLSKDVFFKPWPACEDLHFCNEVEDSGLTVIKLNAFGVTKNRTSISNDLYTWNKDDRIRMDRNGS